MLGLRLMHIAQYNTYALCSQKVSQSNRYEDLPSIRLSFLFSIFDFDSLLTPSQIIKQTGVHAVLNIRSSFRHVRIVQYNNYLGPARSARPAVRQVLLLSGGAVCALSLPPACWLGAAFFFGVSISVTRTLNSCTSGLVI